ncbi:unnamed protein product, partial [Closterium sp. NIES-53]
FIAMARAILSVGLALFLAATLALSFAQATSAAIGVVTAENAASITQPNEAYEQRHRKLQTGPVSPGEKTASDGTACRVVATRTEDSCSGRRGCLSTLNKQRRDCGIPLPTQSGGGRPPQPVCTFCGIFLAPFPCPSQGPYTGLLRGSHDDPRVPRIGSPYRLPDPDNLP